MSILRLPKNFCKSLTADIANFWWSSRSGSKGIHWKSWSYLCKARKDGGMSFKDFNILNSSLLSKQAWRLHNSPNELWAKILKSIYYENQSLWLVKKRSGCSWVWQSILHGRDILLKEGRWTITKNSDLPISPLVWVATGNKIELLQGETSLKVRDLMVSRKPEWDNQKIRSLVSPNCAIDIL